MARPRTLAPDGGKVSTRTFDIADATWFKFCDTIDYRRSNPSEVLRRLITEHVSAIEAQEVSP